MIIKSFQNYVNELFDKVLTYKKREVSPYNTNYVFLTDDNKSVSVFFEYHKSIQYGWDEKYIPGWYLEFSTDGEFDITGTGDAFTIFSTVIAIVKDFLKNPQVTKLFFTATSREQSRVDLYKKMVKVLSKDINFEYQIDNRIPYRPDLSIFVLTRK